MFESFGALQWCHREKQVYLQKYFWAYLLLHGGIIIGKL